jgi:3-oxoadipate enol-lactonase
MGGLIAQQLALDVPHRVRSLSLLCTFSKGAQATRVTPWVLWMGLRTRIGTRTMRRKAFLEMIFPADYLRGRSSKALAERVARDMGRDLADQPDVLMKQLTAMRGHDCSSRLSQLAGIPTLVVSGAQDPIARPEYGRHLSELIPSSRYVEIPQVSHGVVFQDPRQVNRMLRVHLLEADALNCLAYSETA